MHFLKLIFLHFSHSFNQEPHEHSPKSGFYSSSIFLVLRESNSDRFPGFSRFNLTCQRGHSDKIKQFSKTAPFQKLFFHVLCKFPKISLKNSLHNQIFFFLKYPNEFFPQKDSQNPENFPLMTSPTHYKETFISSYHSAHNFPNFLWIFTKAKHTKSHPETQSKKGKIKNYNKRGRFPEKMV